eukprot:Seg2002.3 transcript_id=Seg2002.3/GoldUCD/mRNA.D3Y31 product="hypothetical protein" protein_id=Seg2002.3/GoldUCD/D3Y31
MSGKKSSRRVPNDLKAVQDERLTCRHIQTLMQLQQASEENEDLKNKVQILEQEIMSCQELHTIARESEQNMRVLKNDYERSLEQQMNEMMLSHTRKYDKIFAEKDQLKKYHKEREEELASHIESLTFKNEELKESLEDQERETQSLKSAENDLQETSRKLQKAEEKIESLELKQRNDEKSIEILTKTNSVNVKLITGLERKLEDMSLKLKREIELKQKLIEQNDLMKELERQRQSIESLEKEKGEFENTLEELTSEIERKDSLLSSLERANSLLELEKDALTQSSTDLAQEVEFLKGRERRHSCNCSNFKEYVNIKRELVSLKEENVKLKSSSPKVEFKTLQSDGSRSKRLGAGKSGSQLSSSRR